MKKISPTQAKRCKWEGCIRMIRGYNKSGLCYVHGGLSYQRTMEKNLEKNLKEEREKDREPIIFEKNLKEEREKDREPIIFEGDEKK